MFQIKPWAIHPSTLECTATENSIYVFPENELRGLNPNFQIHASVGIYMYIARIGPHIFLQQNRQPDCGNI